MDHRKKQENFRKTSTSALLTTLKPLTVWATLRYANDTTVRAESEGGLKILLMRVKEEREKVGLKLSIQKLRS